MAVAVGAALGLTVPLTLCAAGTDYVTNCLDDGSTGSLRQVIGAAGDGDTIDLHTEMPLSCSTITLIHGEIATLRNSLSIEGPGASMLTITTPRPTGGPYNRIFNFTGSGTSNTLRDLTVNGGKYYNTSASGKAKGGCIASAGSIAVHAANVTDCIAANNAGGFSAARGGGIYAQGWVRTYGSKVTGNLAFDHGGSMAFGGGIYAGDLYASYSTVADNQTLAGAATGSPASGGGVFVKDLSRVSHSTISGNHADGCGGIEAVAGTLYITNSTVSGNSAGSSAAVCSSAALDINASTIAFNATTHGAAIYAVSDLKLYSSIIAKNTATSGYYSDIKQSSGHTLVGSNNLIVSSNVQLVASVTKDPQLGPLADHGGPTKTHALNPASPAIDQGVLKTADAFDQRGPGYIRVVGSAPDIGAYERQDSDDEIFYNGFDP